MNIVFALLKDIGVIEFYTRAANTLVLMAVLLLAGFLIDLIARKLLAAILTRPPRRTATQWDDIVLEQGVLARLARIVPVVII